MSSDALAIMAACGLALALFVVVVDFVFDRCLAGIAFRRSSAADVDVTVQIDDKGLLCRREGIDSRVSWSAIKDVTMLGDQSAGVVWFGKREGLVIPRSAFVGDQEFEAAQRFIEGKIRAS